MAYEEYLDYIERAKKEGQYVLYTLDGDGKSRSKDPELFIFKTLQLMGEMTRLFMCFEKGSNGLVRDEFISLNEKLNYPNKGFRCNNNPNLVNGDLVSFYFHRENISLELFEKVFYMACKNVNNDYKYHLAIQEYETNDYSKGSELLWVGYAQQYLNDNKKARIKDLNSNIKR